MKCWIAGILSHKALVNAETSHLQLICFTVAVTMASTGLLFRSCGLSWWVHWPFKIKNLIDCESLSKTEKRWEKLHLAYSFSWSGSVILLLLAADPWQRGRSALLAWAAEVPLAVTEVMICPHNAKANMESHQSVPDPDLQDMSSWQAVGCDSLDFCSEWCMVISIFCG